MSKDDLLRPHFCYDNFENGMFKFRISILGIASYFCCDKFENDVFESDTFILHA